MFLVLIVTSVLKVFLDSIIVTDLFHMRCRELHLILYSFVFLYLICLGVGSVCGFFVRLRFVVLLILLPLSGKRVGVIDSGIIITFFLSVLKLILIFVVFFGFVFLSGVFFFVSVVLEVSIVWGYCYCYCVWFFVLHS